MVEYVCFLLKISTAIWFLNKVVLVNLKFPMHDILFFFKYLEKLGNPSILCCKVPRSLDLQDFDTETANGRFFANAYPAHAQAEEVQ